MAAPALSTTTKLNGTILYKITQSGANAGSVVLEHAAPISSWSAQLTGTVDSGVATLTVSNDGTNYVALPTAKSFSAVGVLAGVVAEMGFRYFRWTWASAGSSADVVLWMMFKRFK